MLSWHIFFNEARILIFSIELGIRYAAACETNGRRVEMITTRNIHKMFTSMYRDFMTDVNDGRLPEHVYYFRDGVSEGQYQHVLMQEVRDIKAAMLEVYPKALVSSLCHYQAVELIADGKRRITAKDDCDCGV